MCYQIGKIYRNDWSMGEAMAAAGVVGLAAVAGQIAALEAAILTGPFAFAIKPAIAAGIVKTTGQLVIKLASKTPPKGDGLAASYHHRQI